VDEYVKESDETEEALTRILNTHLNKARGPSRSSVCSSSYRRLASTTSRLRFDSSASVNQPLTSSNGSKSGMSDDTAQSSMTTTKSHHHSGKDDSKAGDRVLRHPVFAMLHQWLNSLALTRSRLTVNVPASLEERTFYDVLNVIREEMRHNAKPKVIKALKDRSSSLRDRAEECDAMTANRRWKLWDWNYDASKEFRRMGMYFLFLFLNSYSLTYSSNTHTHTYTYRSRQGKLQMDAHKTQSKLRLLTYLSRSYRYTERS